jgi:hypothetical protein
VSQLALGKEGGFAECCQEDTRQRYLRCRVSPLTLGKAAVSVTRRRNSRFSLPSATWHSANIFAECPTKSTRQRSLCRCTVCRAFFAECHTRQSLCRVFLRLRRVLQALGEAIDSGSVPSTLHIPAATRPPSHAASGSGEMSHFGRFGPPPIHDTYSLLVLNVTFHESPLPRFRSRLQLPYGL